MKLLVALCVLALVALSSAAPETQTNTRGCIYASGKCVRECEEGTHAYAPGCSRKIPEATCDQPHPQEEQDVMCDFSACYCDAPTVRDTVSGKCVKLEDCPKKN